MFPIFWKANQEHPKVTDVPQICQGVSLQKDENGEQDDPQDEQRLQNMPSAPVHLIHR